MRLSAKIAAIEIENDEVRVAVVKTGGRKPSILEVHAHRASFATEEERRGALILAIQDVIGRLKHKPQLYVLTMGSQHSIVRALAIPFRGRRKVTAAVAFELEPYLAVPIDDLVVDHCSIREVDGETEVLAVGIRRSLLEEHLDLLAEAGVRIESIGLDVAGLTGLWMGGRGATTGLHAVLHVRESTCILTIVYNRTIAFFRPLPIPAERMHTDPPAVSREVRNSVRAFLANWRGEDRITDFTITGIDLTLSERESLEEGLQAPIVYEDLLQALKGSEHARDGEMPPPPEMAPAEGEEPLMATFRDCPNYWDAVVGVASGAAGGSVAFEFCKGPLAPPGTMKGMLLHAAFSASLLVLVLVGAVAYCVLDYRANVDQIKHNGEEIWKIYAETFPDSEAVKSGRLPTDLGGIQSIQYMQDAYEKAISEGTNLPVDILSRPTLLDVLREIAQKLPGDKVQVTEVKIRESRGRKQSVTIQGEVDDVGALNQAFDQLKKSTVLQVDEDFLRQSKPGGKTAFTITATI